MTQEAPRLKKYRLQDGTTGSEWDALAEIVRHMEAQARMLEERIELARLRMQTAEGRPA